MIIEQLTMEEFSAGLEITRTVIVPFGSTEEHGSHLPLATDTLHAVTVCEKLARRRTIFVAPAIPYGVCRSTGRHAGTLSIGTETLKRLAYDVGAALYRQGLRNMVFLTGHAGGTHYSTLVDAGEQLLEDCPELQIAVLTEFMLAAEAGRELIETPGDSHAGEIETSRILHSHPHLVKGTSPCEFPQFPRGILVRDKVRYWPGGVWGDPGKASTAKGEALEEAVLLALGELVDRLEEMATSA